MDLRLRIFENWIKIENLKIGWILRQVSSAFPKIKILTIAV